MDPTTGQTGIRQPALYVLSRLFRAIQSSRCCRRKDVSIAICRDNGETQRIYRVLLFYQDRALYFNMGTWCCYGDDADCAECPVAGDVSPSMWCYRASISYQDFRRLPTAWNDRDLSAWTAVPQESPSSLQDYVDTCIRRLLQEPE